ncbi:MAG: hypothetical protein ABFD69_00950 [Candidatus Sumerlaeia bacterium]
MNRLPEALAVLIPLLYCAFFLAPARHLAPGEYFLGLVHPDQPVYYALAREAFESGNGLAYASPYSNQPDSPRVYSHFCFLVIGYIWKLTGLPLPALDYLLRAVFGIAAMLLVVRLFRAALPRSAPIAFGAAAVISCGGIAWAVALFQLIEYHVFFGAGPASWDSYLTLFKQAESGYGEWYLNVFGNLAFVHELMFHVLFLAGALALVRGRAWLATAMLFLVWWSHPYTGLQLGLIAGAFLIVEVIRGRRAWVLPLLAVAAINILFVAYYLVFLPRFAEHASVYEQMRRFSTPMLASKLLPAYGVFMGLAVAYAAAPDFRRLLKESAPARLMLAWLVVTAGLIFHDKLLFFMKPFQPMHFTRGYLFVPLVYFATCAMGRLKARQNWSSRKYAFLLGILLIVQLPDNLIRTAMLRAEVNDKYFIYQIYKTPRATIDILQKLDAVQPTLTVHAIGLDNVEKLIPVLTHHRAALAHLYNTPFQNEKRDLVEKLNRDVSLDLVHRLKITALLIPCKSGSILAALPADSYSILPLNQDAELVVIKK